MRHASVLLLASVALLASACGGKSGPDNGAPSTNYPAPHPDLPQVAVGAGASGVLATPVIVPVYWSNDPLASQLLDFTSKIGASTTYWSAVTSEYGIGAATMGTPVVLASTSNLAFTDDGVYNMVDQHATTDWPINQTGSTVYVLYFPPGATISSGNFQSCQSYLAYHSWTSSGVSYAIVPRCQYGGYPDIEIATGSASHEIVEAVTDPYGQGVGGVSPTSGDGLWDLLSYGGEVGDFCESYPNAMYTDSEIGYVVQRSWSNAAAAASHNPCQPDSSVYFNAAPELKDTVSLDFGSGYHENTKAVKIAVGQSKTITLDLFSDGDTSGAFSVQALDFAQAYGYPAELSFSFDRTNGVNGEKIHLTITKSKAGAVINGGSAFYVIASKGGHKNFWPVWVSEN